MSSQSTGDGHVTITVTFKLGTDLDKAQVLVENRVAVAAAAPAGGGAGDRASSCASARRDLLLAVHMYSPDNSLDQQYISNYSTLHIRDELLRLPGVGDLGSRAARDYAMRIWIDPDKAAARNLTVEDIVGALRSPQRPGGRRLDRRSRRSAPGGGAHQLDVQTQGRLTTPQQFGDIVVKRDAAGPRHPGLRRGAGRAGRGRLHHRRLPRIRQDNGALISQRRRGRHPAAARRQRPGRPPTRSRPTMKRLAPGLPARPRLHRSSTTRPTTSAPRSPRCEKTLLDALVLVVIVIVVFLQTWRAALIPILAIPVALIGTLRGAGGGRLLAQHAVPVRAWCWPSASSSTTPSWWSRTSSATCAPGLTPARGGARHHGRGRRRAGRHRAGADRGLRAGRPSSAASPASSTAVRADHRRGRR